MSDLNIVLATVGGMLLMLGVLGGFLGSRLYISQPLVALLFGVLIGPDVLGLLKLASWGEMELILEEAARLTLAIALVGAALRLPEGYSIRHWRSLAVLLGLVMPLMWFASSFLAYLILGVPLLVALLIGAVVTPTDPVVAGAIVTGEVAEQNLPERTRHTLSAESGANDGLALLFVLLPILLLTKPSGEAWSQWLTGVLLWDVVAAVILGALIGYMAGRLLEWAQAKEIMEHTSLLTTALALGLTVLGAVKLAGSDGILAVFAAGVAFSMVVHPKREEQQERVQDAIGRFFDLPVFVLLGMALPWGEWLGLGWGGLVLALAVLLLRRLPAVLASSPLIGQVRRTRDSLFLGWFGPIGIAALYYATFSLRHTGVEEAWTVGSLLICVSILAHGATATPFTRLYGMRARRKHKDHEGGDPEER